MKNKSLFFLKMIFSAMLFCAPGAFAQSGGAYEITQFVIATGNRSSGGTFAVENTGGQPFAGGFLQNSPYALYIGFWTPPALAPTAARVTVGGRVTTQNGQGIRNVLMTLTDSNGAIRTTQTTTFGFYRFTEVRVGETYLLTISSKRFIFGNQTRILNVAEELSDLDFIGEN